jgi:hypothetical protein
LWFYYAQVDIQSFHIEVRSIFDYVAKAITGVSPKPKTMPPSFRRLLEWVKKNPSRMSSDLRQLLLDQSDWFLQLRTVRDDLIHQGGYPLVFGSPSDGILFQIYQAQNVPRVVRPILMHNQNVAYFDRYAALIIARTFCFLEAVAPRLRDLSGLAPRPAGTTCSSGIGYDLIRTWMERLLALLEASEVGR